jgi:diguanylate cyclase (GGDEF)-like protein
MLASGRQDRAFFQSMWAALRSVGYWQGEIWNRRKSGEIYPEWLTISTVRDDVGTATGYVGVFTDISRIRHAATQLEHLAHHDALTDLPNRVLLRSRLGHSLDRARRSGSGCAVIFLDLDHFKPVNDRLGHLAGDELLREVAVRIRSRLREPDTLARWGGDEFVAVIEDIGDGAARLASELIDLLQPPFVLTGGALASIGASAGVSLFPRDGDDPEPLLRHADEALYQAKNAGRNCWRIYGEAPRTQNGHPHGEEV